MRRLLSLYNDPRAGMFLALMLMFGIAAGLFGGVMNNYLSGILNIGEKGRGFLELPRELPGLLLVLIIGLLAALCETRILRIALLASIAGMAGMALFGTYMSMAILMIMMWSLGEHIMMPVRSSISVHMAVPGKEGIAIGMVSSLGNTGMLIGQYMIPAVFFTYRGVTGTDMGFGPYRVTFMLAGAVLAAALLASMKMPRRDLHVRRDRIHIRRKFTKYYFLEMFFGARKQVFITFAPYVLIINYGAGPWFMGLLYGISSTVTIFTSPLIGRLIDRFGFRLVIIVDTILLIVVCFFYGYAHRLFPSDAALPVISTVFIIDSALFAVGMARTMYVKAVSSSQQEVTSTLSTGISINHLISILIAMTGGVIWKKFGVEALFSTAALFGFGSFLFSLTLPRHRREND
jgi:predicted MFS family arabinose efflux permease